MQEYAIHRCTKRCRLTDRSLKPGERYYSVIALKGSQTVRYDIAASAWTSPPEDAVAWWQSAMPDAKPVAAKPTPNNLLLEKLGGLCDDPGRENLAYLLAMLLVRRRVLEVLPKADGDRQAANDGTVCLRSPGEDAEYLVYEPSEDFVGEVVSQTQLELQDMLVMSDVAEDEAETQDDELAAIVDSEGDVELDDSESPAISLDIDDDETALRLGEAA